MPRLSAFALVTLLMVAPGLYAQEADALQLPGQGDVRIIVDISGSMKANDPNNLRQPAVRLLARMLPEGADAGVWTFGRWVNMLVPHGEVDDAWRENAVSQSQKINSVALRTNLGDAIEKASDPYLSGPDLSEKDLSNTDFILLTDGKVDLADDSTVNAVARQRILGPLLSGLIERGATLHTVALSDEADLDMLEALAVESQGHFSVAASADELNRAFLRALNAAVPQDQIPLDEEGFAVDRGVEEFTALIFWGEEETSATRSLELITPDGKSFTKDAVAQNMRWAAETGYDLVTVTDPAAGQWQVNGELGEGSRVTVVSDLRMVVSPVPPSFTTDEPISLQIAFFEEDTRIENEDFLKVIDVILRLTSSDGRSGSKILNDGQPPADGLYTDDIASLPASGDYDLEVIADGTTFSRRFSGVTRFIAPEPASTPESEAEAVIDDQPMNPVMSEQSEPVAEAEPALVEPIDIRQIEAPPTSEAPAPEKVPAPAESEMPLWIWGATGGLGLLLIGGGIWFWLRRRKAAGDEAEPDQDSDSEPPTLDEVAEQAAPELEQEPEAPTLDEEPEAEVPELEPEPEPESAPEESPADDEAAKEDDEEDDDEFGLDDFDLSEFDDLPDDDEQNDKPDEDDEKKGQ